MLLNLIYYSEQILQACIVTWEEEHTVIYLFILKNASLWKTYSMC